MCISSNRICDGISDCLYGDDEYGCGATPYPTSYPSNECNITAIYLQDANVSYSFTSPNYPNNYQNYLNCEWTVSTSSEFVILLQFNDFQLEYGYDYLYVGFEENSYEYTFTGSSIHSIISENSTLWIRFYTDYSVTYRGFNATVTALTNDCDFFCHDGLCLDESLVCNGNSECTNGEDELNCVNDQEAPDIINCPMDLTVNTSAVEAFAINVTWVEPTATDNSGETPVPVADYTSGDNMFGIGNTTIQYNVTDSAGNFNDSCSFVLYVEDNENPVIDNCPNDTLTTELQAAKLSWKEPTAMDNSGIWNLTVYMESNFSIGDNTVTYIAEDPSGNTATCLFTITVGGSCLGKCGRLDKNCYCDNVCEELNDCCPDYLLLCQNQEAPDIINCPMDLRVNTSAVEAFAINVTWVEPTATDNSGETPVPVADYTSGDNMFEIGNTTIQYNVTDSAGNFNDSCSFVLYVEDNESPTIDCPANVTSNNYIGEGYGLVNVSTDIGSPNATVTWDPPVTSDNSGGLVTIMSSSFDSGDMIPYGTHTITFTATDPYGNSDTCVFGLKVEDNEDPVLVCPPNITTTTADGSNQALNVSWTDPIVIDNSGEDIKPTSKYYPGNNEFDIGRTDVIYDSFDSSRNSATCTFTVTVIDPEAPDIIGCTIGMIFNTTTGEAFAINVTWMEPTAIDNSGETPVPVADYSSDDNMFPIGDTTVQYNVSDSAGNFNDSCNFVIIVEDNESPMIDCPTNVTSNNYIGVGYELVNVSTDIGSPNATVTWDPPETSDNSGRLVTVMSSSFESGDMIPYGTHTITFTATDSYGNIDTCDFGLNVEDNEDPVLVCPPNITTITADSSDQAVNVTWTDPIVNDNSGEDITPTSKYNPGNNEFYIGIIDVMYDAVDSSGNAATCTFTISVTDNESPTIDCPANVTSNNYIGEGYGLVNVSTDIGSPNATVTWDPLVTSDNSGGLVTVMSSSFESGDMIPYGTHTIIFTASDSFGNIDTCDFGLQVEGKYKPHYLV
ncbi:hyalin-like [Antedon mediterranea]|uniref:hyalin-like n=1 Tax=Antedon mediterranea TaxID=105859 RepID=UPI003AF5490A